MPSAETKNPPLQQHAETTPALRGPSRSTHAPKSAAEEPSITKNSVNIQPSVLIFQSSGADWVMPIALLSGSQKTLKPYAMPMHRCIASAAGGTSHRLNVGAAMIRSFDSKEADEAVAVVVTPRIVTAPPYRMLAMAETSSFDITSPVDFAEVDNALNQARKEIGQRYDFKGAPVEITLNATEQTLTLLDHAEMTM